MQSKQDTEYVLPKIEIKDYNVMIDLRNALINVLELAWKHIKMLEKLLLVKDMITQLFVIIRLMLIEKQYNKLILLGT